MCMTLTGSETAKSGFKYEYLFALAMETIESPVAKKVLKEIGIDIDSVQSIKATVPHSRYKTDVTLQILFKNQTTVLKKISIKKSQANFSQLDRRGVEKYKLKFNLTDLEYFLLCLFTGDLLPLEYAKYSTKKTKKENRMFFTEFSEEHKIIIINLFERIKNSLVILAFKGDREDQTPDYMVTIKTKKNSEAMLTEEMLHICSMEQCIKNHMGSGLVSITSRGSLKIGNFTVQRKGGDKGEPTANDIQVKIKPNVIF